ncbi:MAG TPA: ABC transporter substrate-binding protein, partial [Nitrospira sp.]|nr:ABC transporter substrate-binding protein [Nitrospira sp.]HND03564.1 ABC transporter substrate-binding protein [Nitrospira sp.]HNI20363.1 ABC transporter substrate-binding protein [Nitrospira sp.]
MSRTWVTVGLLIMVSCLAQPSTAAWIDPLTPEERQGRNLYHYGKAGIADPVAVNLQGVEGGVPPALFRCAGCHGHRGEGSQEGGLRVPPLTVSVLRRAREGTSAGRPRAGYTDEALGKAITQGIDASGHALHPSMPRYQLTSDQVAKLIAYLTRLGEEADTDPGVSAEVVTIGAALPLTGPLAQIGQDVAATLRGALRRVNEQGGVYGRHIELIVEDSRGDPAQTAQAVSRLIEIHQVFALVGSFEPAGGGRERFEQDQIPSIFPLTQSPQLSDPPDPSIFYALPGFDLQFRSLMDFFASRTMPLTGTAQPRLALVHRNGDSNSEALRGALEQIRHHALNLAMNYEYSTGRLAVLAL